MASRATSQGTQAGSGWPAVWAVAAGTFVMVTSEFLPIGLLGRIGSALHVSEGRAGLLVMLPGLVAAIAAPLMVIFAGRLDRRHLLLALTGLIVSANIVVASAADLPMALLGRGLLGVALGGFWGSAAAAGRRMVEPAAGDRATALILGGIAVGTVLGVPLGTMMGGLANWRMAFLSAALLAALILAVQWYVLPRLPGNGGVGGRQILAILRLPAIRVGYVAAALAAGGHFAAYTYLQPFLARQSQVEGATIALVLTVFGLAGVLGTWAGERAASRDVAKAFAGTAMLLGLAIATLLVAGHRAWLLLPAMALWGGAFGALPVCVQTWIHRAAPDKFESGSALVVTVFQLAVGTGAFLGGALVDARGTAAAFLFGCVVAASAAPVILIAGSWRLYRRSLPTS